MQEINLPEAVNSATLLLRPQLAVDAGIPELDPDGPDNFQLRHSSKKQTWPWVFATEDWEALDRLERDCVYDFYVRCRDLFVSGRDLVTFLNSRCDALYYTVPIMIDGSRVLVAEKRNPGADLRYDTELLRLRRRSEGLWGRCEDFLGEKMGNRTRREAFQDVTVDMFLFRADQWHKAKVQHAHLSMERWKNMALTAEQTHDELTVRGIR